MPAPGETSALADSLAQAAARLEAPRALELTDDEKRDARLAITRVLALGTNEPSPSLIIALAGGSGVGKSTLINALARADIATAGEIRPTTMDVRVYHHRDFPKGNVSADAAPGGKFTEHDRPELRLKVLVDTPDLDSLARENRTTTQKLLTAAGLVLYVFSPEKYADEKVWSVLREQQRFSGAAAVLNRVDAGVSRADVESICDDLRSRFAAVGVPNVRLFRTAARRHLSNGSQLGPSSSGIDETEQLREFIEQELQETDIAQQNRANRRAAAAHLLATLDSLAPTTLLDKAGLAEQTVRDAAKREFEPLARSLSRALEALEDDFAAASALRQHRRFRGPLRAWLATADLFLYGLPGWVGSLTGRPTVNGVNVVERVLARTDEREVDDMVRKTTRAATDALFHAGLPLARWSASANDLSGAKLRRRVAERLQRQFDEQLDVNAAQGGWVVTLGNVLGHLAPATLVFAGLFLLGRDLWNGQYIGLPLVGHLLAMAVLFLVALHGVVGLLLPRGAGVGQGGAQAAVNDVVSSALIEALQKYRADLNDDVKTLRRPLEKLNGPISS